MQKARAMIHEASTMEQNSQQKTRPLLLVMRHLRATLRQSAFGHELTINDAWPLFCRLVYVEKREMCP